MPGQPPSVARDPRPGPLVGISAGRFRNAPMANRRRVRGLSLGQVPHDSKVGHVPRTSNRRRFRRMARSRPSAPASRWLLQRKWRPASVEECPSSPQESSRRRLAREIGWTIIGVRIVVCLHLHVRVGGFGGAAGRNLGVGGAHRDRWPRPSRARSGFHKGSGHMGRTWVLLARISLGYTFQKPVKAAIETRNPLRPKPAGHHNRCAVGHAKAPFRSRRPEEGDGIGKHLIVDLNHH